MNMEDWHNMMPTKVPQKKKNIVKKGLPSEKIIEQNMMSPE